MKTFADLKRDLVVGKTLTMTFNSLEGSSEMIKKRIGVSRKILKTQSNGVWLDNGEGRNSFLELPCASLTEYDGKTIKIYKAGKRELTENEKTLLEGEPSNQKENEELSRIDMLTDGSRTYWMDKRYYADNDANWRWDWHKGLRLDINDKKMWDKNVKGELELEYILN